MELQGYRNENIIIDANTSIVSGINASSNSYQYDKTIMENIKIQYNLLKSFDLMILLHENYNDF